MADKVYVVTTGCYSDYHIVAVFTDKKRAEELANKFEGNGSMEKYDLNVEVPVHYTHKVDIDKEGDVTKITIGDGDTDKCGKYVFFYEDKGHFSCDKNTHPDKIKSMRVTLSYPKKDEERAIKYAKEVCSWAGIIHPQKEICIGLCYGAYRFNRTSWEW